MIKTAATLFTGGGLYDIGLKQAGIDVLWGVEYDTRLKLLNELNHKSRIIYDDVSHVVYENLPKVDLLHASPSCLNYSLASMGANKEVDTDIKAAIATRKAIQALDPPFFSLENVYQYENSEAFDVIYSALEQQGYYIQVHNIRFDQFGVPQTRNRLFLIAFKEIPIDLQLKTQASGWYSTISDLVPDFKIDSLTKTQQKILAKSKYKHYLSPDAKFGHLSPLLIRRNQIRPNNVGARLYHESAFTVTATLASDRGNPRTKFANIIGGRGVRSLTMRALARFQTVPDDYHLLGNNAIDCLAIGNGVPCKFVKELWEQYVI